MLQTGAPCLVLVDAQYLHQVPDLITIIKGPAGLPLLGLGATATEASMLLMDDHLVSSTVA